jgi:hypothetical protein
MRAALVQSSHPLSCWCRSRSTRNRTRALTLSAPNRGYRRRHTGRVRRRVPWPNARWLAKPFGMGIFQAGFEILAPGMTGSSITNTLGRGTNIQPVKKSRWTTTSEGREGASVASFRPNRRLWFSSVFRDNVNVPHPERERFDCQRHGSAFSNDERVLAHTRAFEDLGVAWTL